MTGFYDPTISLKYVRFTTNKTNDIKFRNMCVCGKKSGCRYFNEVFDITALSLFDNSPKGTYKKLISL